MAKLKRIDFKGLLRGTTLEEKWTLAENWETRGVGPEAIEPILRFMEANPGLDFGAPGPLVHFL